MHRSLTFHIKLLQPSTIFSEFLLVTISGKFYKRRVMGQTMVPTAAVDLTATTVNYYLPPPPPLPDSPPLGLSLLLA